jgi:hypothetical protein
MSHGILDSTLAVRLCRQNLSGLFQLPSVYLDLTRIRLFRALLVPVCALYTPRTRSDAMPYGPYVRFPQTLPPHLASWKRFTQGTSMEAVPKPFGSIVDP